MSTDKQVEEAERRFIETMERVPAWQKSWLTVAALMLLAYWII